MRIKIDEFRFSDWPVIQVKDLVNGNVFIAPDETGEASSYIMIDGYFACDTKDDSIVPVDVMWSPDDKARVIGNKGFWMETDQQNKVAFYNLCQRVGMNIAAYGLPSR